MRNTRRSLVLGLSILTLAVFTCPATLLAPPKINFPGRKKSPVTPPPKEEEAGAEHGFPKAPDEALSFVVDAKSSRNEVVFTSKAPKETIIGKTTKMGGQLELNPRQLDTATGSFEVAWADLDTGNKTRNEHMMAAPWVDSSSYPKIVYTVTGIEVMKKKTGKPSKTIRAKLVGEMSMNGHDKPMKVPVILTYIPAGENKKGEKVKEGVGIKGNFRVALKDFAIEGKGVGQAVAANQQIKVQLFMVRGTAESAEENKEKKQSAAHVGDDEDHPRKS